MSWIKTFSLIIVLSALLVVVGGVLFGPAGAIIFFIIAAVMNFFSFWFSGNIALRMAGAKQVTEKEEPRLHYMVADVARLANMPTPKVFLVQNDSPNAFATGRNPKNAVVAVTTGIQRLLSEDELRGVIAHEMAHIKNRDMLIMAIVAMIAGAISMMAFIAQWSLIFGGMRGGRGGQGNIVGMIGMLLLIILVPMVASVIRFAVSRTREYAADDTGARILNNPLPLARALEKMDKAVRIKAMPANKSTEAMAHMYIVNPLGAKSQHKNEVDGKFVGLFSTHPPIQERIRRLQEMVLY